MKWVGYPAGSLLHPYPLAKAIHSLNNWGQEFKGSFKRFTLTVQCIDLTLNKTVTVTRIPCYFHYQFQYLPAL